GGIEVWYPVISPDGSTLAFSASLNASDAELNAGAIVLMDVATGDFRIIDWSPGDGRGSLAQPQSLSWSADGTHLAFVNAQDNDGTDAFEAFDLDLTTAESLSDAQLILSE